MENNYKNLTIHQKINSKSWGKKYYNPIISQATEKGLIHCCGGYSQPNFTTK